MKKKTNSFCYWNVLRMTQPSSLMASQHWINVHMAVQLNFDNSMAALAHSHRHTNTHARTHSCSQATLARIRVTQMYSFILSIDFVRCAIHVGSIGYDSGITQWMRAFCTQPEANERTNERNDKRERVNRRRTLKLTIVLAYTTFICTMLSLWCHAQNLMAAHCF